MHMIAYISDSKLEEDEIDDATKSIVRVAKAKNLQMGITGVLFYLNGKFLQIIEGDESKLFLLMKSIETDARHQNITYLINTKTSARGFQDWNMDFFMLNKNISFDVQTIKKLTESFERNLLPRTDSLLYYYKTLLAQKTA